MRIVLVGAGNVACSMGPALVGAGYTVAAVCSRGGSSATVLAASLEKAGRSGRKILSVHGIDQLASVADASSETVCVAMLKDDVLQSQAAGIVAALGPDTLYLHTAGSVSANVWKNAGAVRYGVIYPMTSFTASAPVSMREVPLFVEASDGKSFDTAMHIANDISDNVSQLDSNGRLYLHLAAVFANNFPCHMMEISRRILERQGVSFKVMLPLIRGAVEKLEKLTPQESQTGPAVRGDAGVVNHHLAMLADDPEWQTLYRLISKDINPNIRIDD
ncbi:MAG: DUF2520 domain-containing protein [Bacteroidaceae bacterium]|nr:DUF2520 domain-containing protein [Bacteroidaceae bacterium]